MARRWLKWSIVIALAMLAIAIVYPSLNLFRERLHYLSIKVPLSRDARLIGTWKGQWQFLDDPKAISMGTIFHADGTGEFWNDGRHHKPFNWGSENGVLYTRRMAVDYWLGQSYSYKPSSDGKGLRFADTKMFDIVTGEMHRQ